MEVINISEQFPTLGDYFPRFVERNISRVNGRLDVSADINENVMETLKTFLSKRGYIPKKYYVELHAQNEKNKKELFPWHVDSYGAISGTVVTFLYYHYITPQTKGGNLMIKDYTREKWCWIPYKKYTTRTIDIWKEGHQNRLVFMEEDLEHKCEDIEAPSFERQLLSIFIQI